MLVEQVRVKKKKKNPSQNSLRLLFQTESWKKHSYNFKSKNSILFPYKTKIKPNQTKVLTATLPTACVAALHTSQRVSFLLKF